MEMVEQTASGSRVGLRLVEKRWLYVIDERASRLLGLAARGTGCTFGPDISKQCNQQNGFEFVVRRTHQLATDAATNGRIRPRLYAEEMWEPGTSALWIAC